MIVETNVARLEGRPRARRAGTRAAVLAVLMLLTTGCGEDRVITVQQPAPAAPAAPPAGLPPTTGTTTTAAPPTTGITTTAVPPSGVTTTSAPPTAGATVVIQIPPVIVVKGLEPAAPPPAPPPGAGPGWTGPGVIIVNNGPVIVRRSGTDPWSSPGAPGFDPLEGSSFTRTSGQPAPASR